MCLKLHRCVLQCSHARAVDTYTCQLLRRHHTTKQPEQLIQQQLTMHTNGWPLAARCRCRHVGARRTPASASRCCSDASVSCSSSCCAASAADVLCGRRPCQRPTNTAKELWAGPGQLAPGSSAFVHSHRKSREEQCQSRKTQASPLAAPKKCAERFLFAPPCSGSNRTGYCQVWPSEILHRART